MTHLDGTAHTRLMATPTYEPLPAGTKVTFRYAVAVGGPTRCRLRGSGTVASFAYYNDATAPGGVSREGGWYTIDRGDKGPVLASSPNVGVYVPRSKRPKTEPRPKVDKPARETLPRIVAVLGRSDSGEYGAATCPHCGAAGRYVYTFQCDDGTTRGAMAGCLKLFPR